MKLCAEEMACQIRSCGSLPSQQELQELDASDDIEATALLPLDKAAPLKLAPVLHADDPVLLASSFGGAQKMQNVVGSWAFREKTSPHCTGSKSVAMAGCSHALVSNEASLPPLIMKVPGKPGKPTAALTYVDIQKWLGKMWPRDLDFTVDMKTTLRKAQSNFVSIAGIATSNVLPLCITMELFESKVEGIMRFGRWLYATCDGAATIF